MLLGVCLISAVGCVRHTPGMRYPQLTGTCAGACEYYLECRQESGEPVSESMHDACVRECNEVFGSSDSIMAFESLVCEDAVAFVEGSSGRAPGEPIPVESSSSQ